MAHSAMTSAKQQQQPASEFLLKKELEYLVMPWTLQLEHLLFS